MAERKNNMGNLVLTVSEQLTSLITPIKDVVLVGGMVALVVFFYRRKK